MIEEAATSFFFLFSIFPHTFLSYWNNWGHMEGFWYELVLITLKNVLLLFFTLRLLSFLLVIVLGSLALGVRTWPRMPQLCYFMALGTVIPRCEHISKTRSVRVFSWIFSNWTWKYALRLSGHMLSWESDVSLAVFSTQSIETLHLQGRELSQLAEKDRNVGKEDSWCCCASGPSYHQLEPHHQNGVLEKQMLRWVLTCWLFLEISGCGLYLVGRGSCYLAGEEFLHCFQQRGECQLLIGMNGPNL